MVLDFYDLSDILEGALGMPETLARNWTLGKPLLMEGSESTGSKNLYSENDVFRFGLAYQLRQTGLGTDEIKKILRKLPDRLGEAPSLIIIPKDNDFKILQEKKEPDSVVWITINLRQLTTSLKKEILRVPQFREKRAEKKTPKPTKR